MWKGISGCLFLTVGIYSICIRPTSTTLTVTAYDGTGIVQQQPLTLGCNYTDGGSNVVFSWKQGNTIIVTGNVNTQATSFQSGAGWESGVFLGDFTSSLTIQLPASSVTPSIAGQYTCIVSSLTGGVQDTATATVQYAPKIESTFPSSRTVTEFSRLQINCSTYTTPGNPLTTSYTWTYGGSAISSGAVLDINNISRDRRGQYTCTASNTFTPTAGSQQQGIARATVVVDVRYGPGNSVQVTPGGTTALVEGSGPFTATCAADCNPDCSISWRSDTRNLKSGSVSMSNVSRTDQGNYTCQAQNGIGGSREKSITLVVFYLDRPILILDKTEVVENETVSLTCNVESNPTAEIEIRNVDNNTVLVERDTNRLQFTIDRVQCLHNGSFLCTARNTQIGTYSSNKNLNVLCSPRKDFRHKMDNIVAKHINETAALVADVIANPVPEFRWFRQESEGLTNISKDTIHSITNSRLQSVLYINIGRTQDYGDYVIEMENSQGKSQLLFTLTSKGTPFPPTHFRASSVSQTSVTLMWTSNNNGGAPQNFQLKFTSFGNNWINTLKNGIPDPGDNSTVSTEVTGLQASTRYVFTIFSINVFGSSQEVELNVTTAEAVRSASNSSDVGVTAGVVTVVCLLAVLVLVLFFLYRRGVLQELGCFKRGKGGPQTSNPVPEFQGNLDLTTSSASPYSGLDHMNSERQTYAELQIYQNQQTIADNEVLSVLPGTKSPTFENTDLEKKDPLYSYVSPT